MNDKIPPQNIEAEEAILASILLEPNLMIRVAEVITPDSFYVPSHQHIYQAILELYYQEKPTDLMTVTTWLSDHKLLKKIGGKNKLSQLVKGDILPNNIEQYAELVLEKSQRRQLINAAHKINLLGYDTTTEIESIFDQAEEKIFNLTTNKKDKFQPQSLKDCLKSLFNQLDAQKSSIPWRKLERKVFKLQKQIYQASKNGKRTKVRRLQRLLIKSWAARTLAARKVSQDNQGSAT